LTGRVLVVVRLFNAREVVGEAVTCSRNLQQKLGPVEEVVEVLGQHDTLLAEPNLVHPALGGQRPGV
jgi:hypothetical protein